VSKKRTAKEVEYPLDKKSRAGTRHNTKEVQYKEPNGEEDEGEATKEANEEDIEDTQDLENHGGTRSGKASTTHTKREDEVWLKPHYVGDYIYEHKGV
jgi:hypothetical protein